jgi:heat shock protein HslJ
MKKVALALIVCTYLFACKSTQKKETKKNNTAFLESQKTRAEKILFETGIDFFAEGNLPTNWNLKINYDDTIRFSANDGLALKFAYNQTKKNIKKDTSIFNTTLRAGEVNIVIVNKNCIINSKAETYTKQVSLSFNSKLYSGCGNFLYDNKLNGKWVLEKIGADFINVSEYNTIPIFALDITKGNLSGNDGCNTINGKIEAQGNRIKFYETLSTKKDCTKKSIANIISQKINNNLVDYYFKEGKLFLYLSDDSLLVFTKA